jgi:hypothetical protein
MTARNARRYWRERNLSRSCRPTFVVFQWPAERFSVDDLVQGELIDRRRWRQIGQIGCHSPLYNSGCERV